jgi:hypothetical protein
MKVRKRQQETIAVVLEHGSCGAEALDSCSGLGSGRQSFAQESAQLSELEGLLD